MEKSVEIRFAAFLLYVLVLGRPHYIALFLLHIHRHKPQESGLVGVCQATTDYKLTLHL